MKSSLAWLPLASGLLVLVLALGLAFVTVTTRTSTQELASTQNSAAQASVAIPSLSLSPTSGDYNFDATTTYPVGIIIDSAGKSLDGVDIVISFDPAKVQIVGGKVNPTSLFPEVPFNKVDAATGKLRFSALTFNPVPVTGVIGTFSIKPLSRGEANFTFDFVPGATTDSNIAEHGSTNDVLGKVQNASYNFK